MNKYPEALNNVKRVYVESEHYDEEDIRLLQELVDKATPKKPKTATNELIKFARFCPVCKKIIPFEYSYSYCGHCGQALDWSDKDDK